MSKFMGVETVERERMNIAKRTFAAGAGFNYGTPARIVGMGAEERRPSYTVDNLRHGLADFNRTTASYW